MLIPKQQAGWAPGGGGGYWVSMGFSETLNLSPFEERVPLNSDYTVDIEYLQPLCCFTSMPCILKFPEI